MGLIRSFGGRSFGIASSRTKRGGWALCSKGLVAKGQILIELPLSSCLAHSSASLVEGPSSAGSRHCRTCPSFADGNLSRLLVPRFRAVGGCTAHRPFGEFSEWLRLTSGLVTGLSASTAEGNVFSLSPFEAAFALTILEGASVATPQYGTPQWHYLQVLPLAQFLYQGGDPSRRAAVVQQLASNASGEQVALFHDSHACLEVIGCNLADLVLRKYDISERDEQLEWMAQAVLLCARSRLQMLPVFKSRPRNPHEKCECMRPFIAPGIDMLRHSFDLDEVNTKVYVDLSRGCVRAEAFRNIKPGEELFVIHPSPEGAELPGMDEDMQLVLRYGLGVFI